MMSVRRINRSQMSVDLPPRAELPERSPASGAAHLPASGVESDLSVWLRRDSGFHCWAQKDPAEGVDSALPVRPAPGRSAGARLCSRRLPLGRIVCRRRPGAHLRRLRHRGTPTVTRSLAPSASDGGLDPSLPPRRRRRHRSLIRQRRRTGDARWCSVTRATRSRHPPVAVVAAAPREETANI